MSLNVTLGGCPLEPPELIVDRDKTSWGRAKPTSAFAEWCISKRDPSQYPGERHSEVEHVLTIVAKPGTRTLVQLLEAIDAAAVPGATLQVTYNTTSRSTTVLSVETEHTELLESHAVVVLKLTCRPYWHGGQHSVLTSGVGLPVLYDSRLGGSDHLVGGSVPALTRYKVSSSAATDSWALGLRPNPPAEYKDGGTLQPWQDYSGTTKAWAEGGAALVETGTLDAWEELGTPTSFADSNAFGPQVLPLPRIGEDTNYATDWVRAVSRVNGSNLATTAEHYGERVHVVGSSVDNAMQQALGPVPVPGASVPGGAGGQAGWGTDALQLTTGDTSDIQAVVRGWNDPSGELFVGQRFICPANMKVTGFRPYITVSGYQAGEALEYFLWKCDGTGKLLEFIDSGNYSIESNLTNTQVNCESFDWEAGALDAGESYVVLFGLTSWRSGMTVYLIIDDDNYYANGTAVSGTVRSQGSTPGQINASYDLRMTMWGQPAAQFTVQVGVQVYNDTAARSNCLDVLTLLPISWGGVYVSSPKAAYYGIVYDLLSDDPATWQTYLYYKNGSTIGWGHSLMAATQVYGPPMMLQPGQWALVVAAGPSAQVAPGTVTMEVAFIERYLYPQGDE